MYKFKIISLEDIELIIPLVYELNSQKIRMDVLRQRFQKMFNENYECAVVYNQSDVIGVAGLWYSTRHYIGSSVELDHVFIKQKYRRSGLGHLFMDWIKNHVKSKNCNSIELNTYVQNYPSHKFYYNQGFEILGYHFLKEI